MDQLDFGAGGLALHVLEDRKAVEGTRQARIDQHDLEAPGLKIAERLFRIGCLVDIEPILTQIPRNSARRWRYRNGEQQRAIVRFALGVGHRLLPAGPDLQSRNDGTNVEVAIRATSAGRRKRASQWGDASLATVSFSSESSGAMPRISWKKTPSSRPSVCLRVPSTGAPMWLLVSARTVSCRLQTNG